MEEDVFVAEGLERRGGRRNAAGEEALDFADQPPSEHRVDPRLDPADELVPGADQPEFAHTEAGQAASGPEEVPAQGKAGQGLNLEGPMIRTLSRRPVLRA